MENASNALIIAGTILIGVMVLGVGVYLVNSFGDSSRQINKQIEDTKIAEFNYEFTKYEGQEKIRAHDIVSVANLAKENNNSRYGEKLEKTGANASPYYITVIIESSVVSLSDNNLKENFENANEDVYKEFLENYSINPSDPDLKPYYFTCEKVEIDDDTKLIKEIKFTL